MRQIVDFLIKHYTFFLFLLLEGIALHLTLSHYNSKAENIMTSANRISGFYFEKIHAVTDYFSLRESNKQLVSENEKLINRLSAYRYFSQQDDQFLEERQYKYTLGKVIKNSVNRQQNYLTINKGKKSGIKINSAVVSPKGVVGVVAKVSNNYATVVSLLNTNFSMSGELEKTGYFGSLNWDGESPEYLTLNDIPGHVKIQKGDTIVSSGYSAIFPQAMPIGIVSKIYKIKQSNFYRLQVKTLANFRKLDYVYIIENTYKAERDSLEKETEQQFRFLE
jgi:rod shape-determining protein MreC